MRQAEVNLKAGNPNVSFAINSLKSELRRAKASKVQVLKLIHGWGSSGVGGEIKKAVLSELRERRRSGFISSFIAGEDFCASSVSGQEAIKKFPKLKSDRDFCKDNPGVTIVII